MSLEELYHNVISLQDADSPTGIMAQILEPLINGDGLHDFSKFFTGTEEAKAEQHKTENRSVQVPRPVPYVLHTCTTPFPNKYGVQLGPLRAQAGGTKGAAHTTPELYSTPPVPHPCSTPVRN